MSLVDLATSPVSSLFSEFYSMSPTDNLNMSQEFILMKKSHELLSRDLTSLEDQLPFKMEETGSSIPLKNITEYDTKSLSSLAFIVRRKLEEQKREKTRNLSDLEFLEDLERRIRKQIKKAYKGLPKLKESLSTSEEILNHNLSFDSENNLLTCSIMQFSDALGLLRSKYEAILRFPFNDKISNSLSWLAGSLIYGENFSLRTNEKLQFEFVELKGQCIENTINYQTKYKNFTEAFLDTSLSKGDGSEKEHAEKSLTNALKCFVLEVVTRRAIRLKLFDVEVKGETIEERKNELFEIVKTFKNFYLERSKRDPKVFAKELNLSSDDFIQKAFSDGKTPVGIKQIQTFIKENFSEEDAFLHNRCIELLRFEKTNLEELSSKSRFSTSQLETFMIFKWLQMASILNQILFVKPLNEQHLVLQRTFGEEKSGINPFFVGSDIEIGEDLNSLKVQMFSRIHLMPELVEEFQENFDEAISFASFETNYTINNLNSSDYEEKIQLFKNLRFEWKASLSFIFSFLNLLNPEIASKTTVRRFLKLSKKIKKLSSLDEDKIYSCYNNKKIILEPIEKWKSSGYLSFLRGFNEFALSGEMQGKVVLQIKNLLEEFLKELKIIIRLYSQDFLLKHFTEPLTDSAKAVTLFRKSLSIFEKNLEAYSLFSPKEDLHLLYELIDKKILPLFPEELKKDWLTVPETPRTTLDVVLDCIYSSSRASDIDWKIIRYKKVLSSLKERCKEFYSELSVKEKYENLDHFLNEDFLDAAEEKQLQCIIKTLINWDKKGSSLKEDKETLDALRRDFEEFLPSLRNLVSSNTNSIYVKMGRLLCKALISELSLRKESELFIRKFYDWGNNLLSQEGKKTIEFDAILDNDSTVPYLELIYENINRVPFGAKRPPIHGIFNSLKGRYNFCFDPMLQGNIPDCLFYLKEEGEEGFSKVLGLGSPTMQGTISYAEVTPEFLSYLEELQAAQKNHFFILNQNMIANYRFVGEVETDRIQALLDIANQKFKDTLYLFLSSMNSPFYYQAHEFSDIRESEQFCYELHAQFFSKPAYLSGNAFSDNIFTEIPDLPKFSEKLIEVILKRAFCNKPKLEREERQIFIDLFQDFLAIKINLEILFESMNASCKDAIDRAAKTIARLFALIGIITGSDQSREFRLHLICLIFARALMVRKRVIIKERLDRLIVALQFYEANKEILKQIFADLFPGKSLALKY